MKRIKDELNNKLLIAALFVSAALYSELCLQLTVFGGIGIRFLYTVLFSVIAGLILFILSSVMPQKAVKPFAVSLIALTVIWFEVQLVYHCIFGTFMPFSQLGMGGAAITGFFSQMLHAIGTNILKVLVLFLPVPVSAVLLFLKKRPAVRLNLIQTAAALLLTVVLWLVGIAVLQIDDNYALLTNPNATADNNIKNFGVFAALIEDVKGMIFTSEASSGFNSDGTEVSNTDGNGIDFAALAESTDDEELKKVDNYLATQSALPDNQYTGIAEGYNLITICAEAFSPYLIDPELTPALYKLSTSGFVFKNFYNSFPNTTTNGEYTFCTGLMPDMSKNKIESSFNASADNYLALCLGNLYKDMGYTSIAYHNYYGTFYDRHITHANMGYDFKAILSGLEMEIGSPSSDLDMIETSMPDYINSNDPFHVYYMTYSGHYQYNWENEMANKNRDKVEHLPYSDEVKAYIACNLELEYALQALMQGLEDAGKADSTVIVLTADHYPYGLNGNAYDELAGESVDRDFEKYRNTFICYVPGIETVEVDSYCSTPDILPTVLNIMGIEYDSRLLAGTDVLADASHFAVLSDRSFIAEEMRYNAATDEVIYTGEPDAELFEQYRNMTDNIFTLSSSILATDYYAHVFDYLEKEEKPVIVNFEDITNNDVYIESTVTFMVSNGYMEPKSETVFGKDDPGTVGEFAEILYRMAGRPKEYESSRDWAPAVGLASESELASEEAGSYLGAARIIYRFVDEEYTMEDFSEKKASYPHLSDEDILSLGYCRDKGIILGDKYNNSFDLCDTSLTRYHIAAFAQRMYMYGLIG